ncbi:MAG: hypothetical protein AMXMBFR58_05170 [Phycisphaerae bacterium]|nr:Protein-arginine kinase activator protein [Phycisphaerales bacterium]MCK6477278.1 UvrB/UvrC motif-containing protein [Phycisphaerales bacterium]
MKCDRCDNEATVQEISIRNGARIEIHLCEQCARQAGLAAQTATPLAELLTKYVLATGIGATIPARSMPATECPKCKLSWDEFRRVDRLGCPDCYAAFEGQLGPLLERAHEGGLRHAGKVPARAGRRHAGRSEQDPVADLAQRVAALRKQLEQAVATEQYEKAAGLRDQIRRLEDMSAGPAAGTLPDQ